MHNKIRMHAAAAPTLLAPDRPLPAAKKARVNAKVSVKRKFVQSLNPTALSFDARLAPKLAKKFPHLYSGCVDKGYRDAAQGNRGVVTEPASICDGGTDAVQRNGSNAPVSASKS